MPDPLRVLCDQNIPIAATEWLRLQRPSWIVQHVDELGLAGQSDEFLYHWVLGVKA